MSKSPEEMNNEPLSGKHWCMSLSGRVDTQKKPNALCFGVSFGRGIGEWDVICMFS